AALSGKQWRSHSRRTVITVAPEEIVCNGDLQTVVIPVADVLDVWYERERSRRSDSIPEPDIQKSVDRALAMADPRAAHVAAAMALAEFGLHTLVWRIADEFTTTHHFVTLTWVQDREVHRVKFRMDKREYASLLEELARVTGKLWRGPQQPPTAVAERSPYYSFPAAWIPPYPGSSAASDAPALPVVATRPFAVHVGSSSRPASFWADPRTIADGMLVEVRPAWLRPYPRPLGELERSRELARALREEPARNGIR
ncbi:MAG: hypothetical protein ACREUU_15665, partial [Gammaproteobacteria bacterium]